MTVKENLIAAKALIADPNKWGKGLDTYFAKDGCPMCAHEAVRVSTDGAGTQPERDALADQLPAAFKQHGTPAYNDHPDTAHADIMALFDRAIAAQEITQPSHSPAT